MSGNVGFLNTCAKCSQPARQTDRGCVPVRNSSPPAGFMNPSRPLIHVYQPLTRVPTKVPMVFAPANAVYQSTAFAEGGAEGLRRSASKPASRPANRPASTPARRPASPVPDDGRPHFEVSNKIGHFKLSRPRWLSGHPKRLSGRPRRFPVVPCGRSTCRPKHGTSTGPVRLQVRAGFNRN